MTAAIFGFTAARTARHSARELSDAVGFCKSVLQNPHSASDRVCFALCPVHAKNPSWLLRLKNRRYNIGECFE